MVDYNTYKNYYDNVDRIASKIPSLGIGTVAGISVGINRAQKRSKKITNYIAEKNLPKDKFTRQNIEKELLASKKIFSKFQTVGIPVIIAVAGATMIFEMFKRTIYKL